MSREEEEIANNVCLFVAFANQLIDNEDVPVSLHGSELRVEVGNRWYAIWNNTIDAYNPCGRLFMHIEMRTGLVRYPGGTTGANPIHRCASSSSSRLEDVWRDHLTSHHAIL